MNTQTSANSKVLIYPKTKREKAETGLVCQGCALASQCLSSDSGESFLSAVQQGKPLKKGQHVYRQGDAFKSLFVVRSGALKAYNVSATGTEQVLGFYLPGDIVGFDGLASGAHINGLQALDTTSLCELPFKQIAPLLSADESRQRYFFSLQSQVLNHQQQQLLQLCQNTAEERLAAFLLDLSQRFEQRHLSSSRFNLPMCRKDIASYLGLAVETLSRLFGRFQDSGWIAVRGRDVTLIDLSLFAANKTLVHDKVG